MFRQGIALFGPTQCLDMFTPGWRVAGDGCGVYHARGAQHGRANKVYQALPGFLKKNRGFRQKKGIILSRYMGIIVNHYMNHYKDQLLKNIPLFSR